MQLFLTGEKLLVIALMGPKFQRSCGVLLFTRIMGQLMHHCFQVKVAFRVYRDDGEKEDESGKFMGWRSQYDEWLTVTSFRIQPLNTMAQGKNSWTSTQENDSGTASHIVVLCCFVVTICHLRLIQVILMRRIFLLFRDQAA